MAAQQPRGLRLSYARLHSARATVGITPRPGALPDLSPVVSGGWLCRHSRRLRQRVVFLFTIGRTVNASGRKYPLRSFRKNSGGIAMTTYDAAKRVALWEQNH